MNRILTAILISLSLIVSGCASSFSSMAGGEVCGDVASFSARAECLREFVGDPGNDTSKQRFLAQLALLEERVNNGTLTDQAADTSLSKTLMAFAEEERAGNQRAWAMAAIGVVAVAAVAAAASADGGGGYNSPASSYTSYQRPLMCSQAPSYASPRCTIGKACGNTCIQLTDRCHIGRGSACNVYPRAYP